MVWGAPRGIQDLVERVRSNDPSLKSLCLMRGRRFEEGDAMDLCAALEQNTTLGELSIGSHAVGPAAAAAFARMLAANTTLGSLDLGNSTFGDEGLAALAPGIAASCSLRQLNLERKGITAAGCASLASALASSSSGRQGGEGGCGGSSSSSSSSKGFSCLEELLLGQNSLGAEGLAALLSGLGSSLRVLDLTACGLAGAEGVQPLAAALLEGQLPRLSVLRLNGNELGASGAAALAPALGGSCDSGIGCTHAAGVQQLHLQCCQLGGEAVAALAAALPASLAVLDLSGNAGMGQQGAAALAAALEAGAAPRLRRLLLCGCGMEDESVAELAAALAQRGPAAGEAAGAAAGAGDGSKGADAAGGAAAGAAAEAAAAGAEPAGAGALALDLSGNSAGAVAVAALAAAPLASLCLHDCKLGGGGGAGEGDAPDAAATEAAIGQLAAPGAFRLLGELDVSGNRLQAEQLLALLAALMPAGVGSSEEARAEPMGEQLPCPRLRLLVIAANPGASNEQVSDAIERLQEARPGLDVVRRAADTGEGGLMN